MDWASIIAREHAKEEEMSRLVAGFIVQMHKRVAGSEGESTPISDGKHQKRSSLDEEAQKDWAIISVDSPDLSFNDHSVLEGTHSEAGTPMEEGILTGGPSNVDEIGEGAPSGVAAAPVLPPRPADIESGRKRPPDQVLLSTCFPPQERIHPPTGMVAPDLEGAWEIIHH